jgi:rRNA biogenesis protein RRP5
MAGQKRRLDDGSNSHKSKKSKLSGEVKTNHERQSHKSSLLSDEVDFPRGGGTSFTPLEVKTIRAEAVKEANEELFEVSIWLSVVLLLVLYFCL